MTNDHVTQCLGRKLRHVRFVKWLAHLPVNTMDAPITAAAALGTGATVAINDRTSVPCSSVVRVG